MALAQLFGNSPDMSLERDVMFLFAEFEENGSIREDLEDVPHSFEILASNGGSAPNTPEGPYEFPRGEMH